MPDSDCRNVKIRYHLHMSQRDQDVGFQMKKSNLNLNPTHSAFWTWLVAVTTIVVLLANPHAANASRVRRQATAGHRHRRVVKKKQKLKGQRAMEPQRVTEIQQALIRAHYLQGEPTGTWDASSQAAMQKFQSANGWQTKITPDSRALIKLGLGPKQDAGEYAASNVSQKNPARATAAAQNPAMPDHAEPDRPSVAADPKP